MVITNTAKVDHGNDDSPRLIDRHTMAMDDFINEEEDHISYSHAESDITQPLMAHTHEHKLNPPPTPSTYAHIMLRLPVIIHSHLHVTITCQSAPPLSLYEPPPHHHHNFTNTQISHL